MKAAAGGGGSSSLTGLLRDTVATQCSMFAAAAGSANQKAGLFREFADLQDRLQFARMLVLVLGEERHGVARRAGAARAADTVHVVFAPAMEATRCGHAKRATLAEPIDDDVPLRSRALDD